MIYDVAIHDGEDTVVFANIKTPEEERKMIEHLLSNLRHFDVHYTLTEKGEKVIQASEGFRLYRGV